MKSRRLVLQSSNQIINGWVRPEPNNRTMTQRLFMGSKVLKPVYSHLFRRESKYLDGRFQVCVIKKGVEPPDVYFSYIYKKILN